jgi:endonuclease III
LIRHGKQVCKAQTPNCVQCILAEACNYARAHD